MRKYVLAPLIAAFYWFWSRSWRLKIHEEPEFKEALRNGPVIFAHWHGDEMVVLRVGPKYKSAAMTSTSKDGELMTQILKIYGFGISRGSSTRGGVRALVGMIHLMKQGYNATVAVDGPKGPIYKVKPGVWALAKHSKISVVPTGVAKKSALVFKKAWNKTYLPWPFSKVAISFGRPLSYDENLTEQEQCQMLENKLNEQRKYAQTLLVSLLIMFSFFVTSCSSNTPQGNSSGNGFTATLGQSIHNFLKPKGRDLTGKEPPIIQWVQPGGLAQKYGFKIGDKILKINGREISTSIEFQKKIKFPANPTVLIDYVSKNGVANSRSVQFSSEHPKFGASTEIQNTVLIAGGAAVASINRGPHTVYCSVSVNKEGTMLYANLIVDSETHARHVVADLKVIDKKRSKVIGSSDEGIDALGSAPALISRSFMIDEIPASAQVTLTLEKQHFTFEFQN